ncbi:MAG: MarR family transcriptional regulator [Candidatus Bathyarchaeia archaeon]
MKRSGKQLKRASENQVLAVLAYAADKLSWSDLYKLSGLSESTLSSSLKSLVDEGLVERQVDAGVYPPAVYYTLTDKGLAHLEGAVEAEGINENEQLPEHSNDLAEFVQNYFRLKGLGLDLSRSRVSVGRVFFTFGLLPLAELARAYVPTAESVSYLMFMSNVYVGAVNAKALVDMPVEKQFETVRFFWKLCSTSAFNAKEAILGFTFDYPSAFNQYIKEMDAQILAKAFPYAISISDLRRAVFARLKVITHPISERRKIVDKIWKVPQ